MLFLPLLCLVFVFSLCVLFHHRFSVALPCSYFRPVFNSVFTLSGFLSVLSLSLFLFLSLSCLVLSCLFWSFSCLFKAWHWLGCLSLVKSQGYPLASCRLSLSFFIFGLGLSCDFWSFGFLSCLDYFWSLVFFSFGHH